MKIRMLRTLRHAGQPCWLPFSAGETYPATEATNMPPRPDGKRQVFAEQDNGPGMLCTIGEDCAEVQPSEPIATMPTFEPFPPMTILVAESPLEFKRPSGRTLRVKTGDRFVVTGSALSQRYGHVLIARERGAHLGVGELISAEHAHNFFYVAP